MRYLIYASMAVLLCGCESEEEHHAKFMTTCTASEFSAKQCEVLYSVRKASENAETAASIASINSGIALGMSAGRGGR